MVAKTIEGTRGFPTGAVFGFNLIKHIRRHNILWKPEPSFTISKALLNEKRPHINKITFKLYPDNSSQPPEVYSIPLTRFDLLKIEYDYGNGVNYRIAIKDFYKEGKQGELKL